MDFETLREYCLSFPEVTECFPFDESTLVFKVSGKMFLYTDLEDGEHWFNVKCDPEKAIELREKYSFVIPGFHANKKYWNTVRMDGVRDDLLQEWIFHSYTEVIKKLPKSKREELEKSLNEI
ncbi:MmcQ/YjbR family DNA-binding protein [Coprobacter tertius]|uniref:MmcQ/YjbR family DNA-binding protein n=1 Tax=Coprobacter tertius TaxID=2944915 RepID=A0ABT1MJF7_9BACT|nr:MmcQ/YjbR family DNA-binding protein [Coprobacter tertius]MCP9612745.1 MmcQ/YjbR family DNA-binding protein [Coprobacter tertius]